MALTFTFDEMIAKKGQAHYDKVTTSPLLTEDGKPQWHPVTTALVWASEIVGLNHINENNVEEWNKRIAMLQGVRGHDLEYCSTHVSIVYITRHDIKNHVGMRTNAGRLSKAEFYARLAKMAYDEGVYKRRVQDKDAFTLVKEHYDAVRNTTTEE